MLLLLIFLKESHGNFFCSKKRACCAPFLRLLELYMDNQSFFLQNFQTWDFRWLFPQCVLIDNFQLCRMYASQFFKSCSGSHNHFAFRHRHHHPHHFYSRSLAKEPPLEHISQHYESLRTFSSTWEKCVNSSHLFCLSTYYLEKIVTTKINYITGVDTNKLTD